MSFANAISLLYNPAQEWKTIASKKESMVSIYLSYLIFFAAIPPISAYIGATYVGWNIAGETHKLTPESALYLSIIAYVAILVAVLVIAWFVGWMARTYGAKPSFDQCLALVAYSCTPLFVVGLFGAYPILWLDMLVSLLAIAMAVKLLYKGVPVIMNVNEEKGFLFASSVLTVCMVSMVGMLAITIVFWGSGFMPVFITG